MWVLAVRRGLKKPEGMGLDVDRRVYRCDDGQEIPFRDLTVHIFKFLGEHWVGDEPWEGYWYQVYVRSGDERYHLEMFPMAREAERYADEIREAVGQG